MCTSEQCRNRIGASLTRLWHSEAMRTLAALAVLSLAACRPTRCEELQCLTGQVCGFKSETPECFNPCDADAGVCADGAACSCAGSCPLCEDCVRVCPRRLP